MNSSSASWPGRPRSLSRATKLLSTGSIAVEKASTCSGVSS
ncbi:hypothetical protein R2601_03833 [Salipiger bermudensis HTCC2601]|uniref:Uncharacterized protein n=1 Tax=Salipiger bermudensis (strain DSM 26914 / JCM 13377 / KCTC 12554 / HTCC2601) TaxID=314265 RepID=Q0FW79_SALBH|nr:hypothetical protein R2601_03833 [Salipiger bermudensis HTCC2601]